MSGADLAGAFVRWTWLRAVLHQGWWLLTSVYLVVDAGLSPAELVVIGAAQGVVALLCEVPAGVLADTVSRKWSLVLSQVLMGTAMLLTGLVTAFPALVATQMLWGLSWTFASGADVAWLTDELDRPAGVAPVLARAARAQLTGAAAGMMAAGALAWATQRATAMVAAGAAMALLGLYVAWRFREVRFVPTRTRRRSAALGILIRGAALVRRRRALVVIFGATFLVNGAADAAGRLYPKQLLDRGFSAGPDPVAGFAVLGVFALLVGAAALRLVERRLGGRADRRAYALAAAAGTAGLLLLAGAPGAGAGSAAVLLVAGIANPLTRTIGTIWVNARTSGDVRATVHSFLAQAEYLGEITCGLALAAVAHRAGLPAALAGGAVLFALAAGVMLAAPPDHAPPQRP